MRYAFLPLLLLTACGSNGSTIATDDPGQSAQGGNGAAGQGAGSGKAGASSVGGASGGGHAGGGGAAGGASQGGAGGGGPCVACVDDGDCGGETCAQLAGDTYCAPSCGSGVLCPSGTGCATVSDVAGNQVQVCVPLTDVCGPIDGQGGAGGAGGDSGAGGDGSEGGAAGSGGEAGAGGGGGAGKAGAGGGTVAEKFGPDGGTLKELKFAIVGDTRPPAKNDTKAYPSSIIKTIWQQIEAGGAPFAVTTGDYVFAGTTGPAAGDQIDLYMAARKSFKGYFFPTIGNHECTGGVASNCGPGNKDGETAGYKAFLNKMLGPIGKDTAYYAIHVASTEGDWTAKFVLVAANAWDAKQAKWLKAEMAKKTTYTFIVRHEPYYSDTAPGLKPSEDIISQFPYTIELVGHTHTLKHVPAHKTLIIGNGGAPLTGSVDYGYTVAHRRASDGAIVFQSKEYKTDKVAMSFAVKPNGAPAP